MTLRLDAGTAEAVAGRQESAASDIDDSAPTMPGSIDGGEGTAHLMEIVAAVAQTSGEIAAISSAVGAQVRDCATDLGLTEAEVAAAFATMNEALP